MKIKNNFKELIKRFLNKTFSTPKGSIALDNRVDDIANRIEK